MTPGDILITLRTVGDLRKGDVVTVTGTCADGEYLYLDGYERQAFRADAFMVAVRRPWHAWAEPGWETKAREAAARFVREGLVPTIRSDPGSAYLDKPRTLSCGHTMTPRATACPTCLVEMRTALREIRSSTSDAVGLRAIARAALSSPSPAPVATPEEAGHLGEHDDGAMIWSAFGSAPVATEALLSALAPLFKAHSRGMDYLVPESRYMTPVGSVSGAEWARAAEAFRSLSAKETER